MAQGYYLASQNAVQMLWWSAYCEWRTIKRSLKSARNLMWDVTILGAGISGLSISFHIGDNRCNFSKRQWFLATGPRQSINHSSRRSLYPSLLGAHRMRRQAC